MWASYGLELKVSDFNSLHAFGEIFHAEFGIDHHRVQTGVAQQAGQAAQVAGIGIQVSGGERVAQCMGVDRVDAGTNSVLLQHTSDRTAMTQSAVRSHPERSVRVFAVGVHFV